MTPEDIKAAENWKDIPGYEGLYMVSNLGRVKGLPKSFYLGPNLIQLSESILNPGYNKTGYCIVNFSIKSKIRSFRVHRLVAKAFIPIVENKPYVNHKNGIRGDNRVDNLEWCTQKENIRHSFLGGYRKSKILADKFSEPLIGKFIVESGKPEYTTGDGAFYHYDEMCTLLKNYAQLKVEEYKKSPEFYKILNQVKDKGYYDL